VTALYFIFTSYTCENYYPNNDDYYMSELLYGLRLDREWNNVTGVNKFVFEHNFEMLCTTSMFAVHAV